MDQAINDMPRTDHRQLVFQLSYGQTLLTLGLFYFHSCMYTLEVSASRLVSGVLLLASNL